MPSPPYPALRAGTSLQLEAPPLYAGAGGVDVQSPGGAISEAAMVTGPLAAMQKRLQELLADWPENALLMQLLAIGERIQGALHACQLRAYLRVMCISL